MPVPFPRGAIAAVLSLVTTAPLAAQLRWSSLEATDLPQVARHAAAYDSVRNEILVFGGRDSLGATRTWTWRWNGAAWRWDTASAQPPGRSDARMVFDPVRGRAVLFGGRNIQSGELFGDTWEFDGTRWEQRTFALAPAARYGHRLVWDEVRGRAVLHGGFDIVDNLLGDTWEYDGVRWTPIRTIGGPGPRARHAMAYDPVRRRVVLYSGQQDVPGRPFAHDLWEWDGGSWGRRDTLLLPPGRFDAEMAFDRRTSSMHVYGGTTQVQPNAEHFELVGIAWVPRVLAPGARIGHAMLDVPGGGPTVVGGFMPVTGYSNDIVRLTASGWDAWPRTTGATAAGGLAVLGASRDVIQFGGFADGRFFATTWRFPEGGDEWEQLSLATSPTARSKFAMTGHPTRDEIVLFGGTDGSQRNDTWLFDGTRWREATPPVRPGRRQGIALAYHPASDSYVTFSGRGSTSMWTDTLLFRNGLWTSLQPSLSPPARQEYGIAYEGLSGGVLLFGGLGVDGGRRDDTWLFDGTSWRELTPATRPTARSGCTLTWDEERQRVVLFGGNDTNGDRGDVWEWNGVDWLLRSPTGSFAGRQYHTAVYDPSRRAVLVHGGQNGAPVASTATASRLAATRAGTVEAVGASCDAAATLTSTGSPYLGAATFGLRHTTSPAPLASVLILDGDSAPSDFAGCALFVPGLLVQVRGAQSGDIARFSIPLPLDPAFAGIRLRAQAFGLRSGGPLLGAFAPSPGVRITIGD